MASVVELLAGAQFNALSAISDALGEAADFQGLTMAAKCARRRGLVSPNLARRLERLDMAAHVARHCTRGRMQAIVAELVRALASQPAEAKEEKREFAAAQTGASVQQRGAMCYILQYGG